MQEALPAGGFLKSLSAAISDLRPLRKQVCGERPRLLLN